MRKHTVPTLAGIVLAGTLALTGCSGEPVDEPAPAPTVEETTPAPAPEPVPSPADPEVVTPSDPGTYDPGPQVIGPPPAEPETEQYELTELDRIYLLDVRLQVPGHTTADEDLIAAGFLVCLAYEINRDLGIPDTETRAELMAGLTGDEAQLMAAVDAAATHHYCTAGGAA